MIFNRLVVELELMLMMANRAQKTSHHFHSPGRYFVAPAATRRHLTSQPVSITWKLSSTITGMVGERLMFLTAEFRVNTRSTSRLNMLNLQRRVHA